MAAIVQSFWFSIACAIAEACEARNRRPKRDGLRTTVILDRSGNLRNVG